MRAGCEFWPNMSRLLPLLFNKLPSISNRAFPNHKVHYLCNQISRQCSVRQIIRLESYGSLIPVLRHPKRGHFDLLGTWQEHNYGKNTKLVIVSGILTFLGLQKEEERESELITTMKRGVLLMQRGEFQKSEQMLHIALKLAQEQQNSDAITYIYDLLANVAFEAHDLPKAEKLFVSVLQRLLSTGTAENDNKILHISLKLASIHKEKGNNMKAEEGFKFCENHLQKKVGGGATDEDTLLLWAMTLDWYARFALEQNRFKEAFTFFEKAYETSLRVNGLVHEQNVILLNDLGTVCCLQNNYDEAIKYLNQAICITKKIPDMEDAASVYINLGTVYLKRKMFEEAKQACKEGWQNAKHMNNKEALAEANICLEELKALHTAQSAV